MHLSFRQNISRRSSFVTSLVLAIAATAVVSGPVAAYSAPMSDYGNTVECHYKTSDPSLARIWWLKHLVVTRPVVYAKKPSQTVGWQFLVNRVIWDDGQGPSMVTYTSPIQKRTATPTTAATFTSQGVDVKVPKYVENKRGVQYTVTLKLYWYRANGSIGSQVTYLMPYMKSMQFNTYYVGDYGHDCWSGYYEGP